ncbi:MAG: M23 family metallopeptidase, partial [Rhodothermales bacterium]|nr:M23 family metallopeptidase [Rhodothermales bacterium]
MPRLPALLLAALLLPPSAVLIGCEVRSGEVETATVAAADSLAADSARAERAPKAPALALRLPTANDALLRGDEGAFYQALDRTIPGLRPHGWEGGRYGFVRSPARTRAGLIFSQLHEGLDIRPLRRDRQGEPLDTVYAVADGTVAYVNQRPGASSYGRYVVVRHRWDASPVYSLYAHLSEAVVDSGAVVEQGAPLGRMGWTGRGTARHRAHVHFEIGLLLNRHFQRWFDAYYGSRNWHGLYFGRNLMGVNPAALYEALR